MSDRAMATALAIVTLISRLPFVTTLLYDWDSALYAQALEHGFHVDTQIADERPHPPGYVFYLGIARTLRLVTGDSNAALVAVSVLASAAAVAALYLLARRYTTPSRSAMAALGLATAPLFWQRGEIAMPYTLLALLSTALAALFLAAREQRADATAVGFAFGALAGFRQDLVLLLAPLWVWSLLPIGAGSRLRALVAFAMGCALWLGASAVLQGGLIAYLGAVGGQTTHVATSFSAAAGGVAAVTQNVLLIAYALAWGLAGFGALLLVAGGARLLARKSGRARDAEFFVLWIVPALVVYVTLHIGEPGYVLSVLPAFYVVAAAMLATMGRRAVMLVGPALIALDAALFLFGSGPVTRDDGATHDRELAGRIAALRALDPASTRVVAEFDYTLARYYVPEFRTLFYGDAPETLSHTPIAVTLDPRRDRVFVFGPTTPIPDGPLVAYDVERR